MTHTGTSLLKRFVAFSTYDVFHDEGSPSMTWEDVGWCVIARVRQCDEAREGRVKTESQPRAKNLNLVSKSGNSGK